MNGRMETQVRAANGRVPELCRLMNVDEVADLLGVSIRHVRRLVFEGRIPYLKWGRLLRFDPRDLGQWLEEARR